MFLVYPSCGSGQTLNHFPIQGSSWCQINLDMRQQRELTQLQPQQHWRIFSLQKALLSPHNHYQDFAESSVGNESACNAGDPGSISGSGRPAGEGIGYPLQYSLASLVAQLVKNPPTMWETWVRSLGWEDPLEKGKDTHSSILAWRIPWTVWSMGSQRATHD